MIAVSHVIARMIWLSQRITKSEPILWVFGAPIVWVLAISNTPEAFGRFGWALDGAVILFALWIFVGARSNIHPSFEWDEDQFEASKRKYTERGIRGWLRRQDK